jgi:hypothetical protein
LSPSVSPTLSPTYSPTIPVAEIVHHFHINNTTKCGITHYKIESTPVDIYHCLGTCDNDELCASVSFDDDAAECKLFNEENTVLSYDSNMICFEKEYGSPQNRYFTLIETTIDMCTGELLFSGYGITDQIMNNPPLSECRSLCNTMYDCVSFTYSVNATNADHSDCTFYTGQVSTAANDIGFDSNCYFKDQNVLSAFVGHEDMTCGADVHSTITNVLHSYHSCYVECNGDQLCKGFEFNNNTDSCSLFRNISLSLMNYKTCYAKSYGVEQIGKHSVRLIFLDAIYSAEVHGSQTFKDYMTSVLEYILHENVVITAVVSGSVVVDFLVTSKLNKGLGNQDTVYMMDRIIDDGNIYSLGKQLAGGSNPPPPTKNPTNSPTNSPTTSPTISPTMAPTMSPTMAPTISPTTGAPTTSPTISPTTSPTTGAPTISPTSGKPYVSTTTPILHNPDTVEIIKYIGYVLLGLDGVFVLYFIYQISKGWHLHMSLPYSRINF